MVETLEDIGSSDFLTLVERSGMMDMIEDNVTLFVPTNEAMQEFMADLEAEVRSSSSSSSSSSSNSSSSNNSRKIVISSCKKSCCLLFTIKHFSFTLKLTIIT